MRGDFHLGQTGEISMHVKRLTSSVSLMLVCLATFALAQEKMQAEKMQTEEAGEFSTHQASEVRLAALPNGSAQFRGRLPRFYSSVIDVSQRDAIYAIQRSYRTKIDELTQQLEQLKKAEAQEIEQQLSAEQHKQVEQMRRPPLQNSPVNHRISSSVMEADGSVSTSADLKPTSRKMVK
jgi:hypothetical protein